MNDGRKLLTIVCPVMNEEKSVPLFYERLVKAVAPLEEKVRIELLFINNRSVDSTLEIVRGIAAKDPRVRYLTLSRNYGYQAAITCGMQNARGDAIANIDVDCEDPPEMIPRFVDRWLSGVDIVYGLRDKREEFFLMHLGRKLFYRVMHRIADHEIVLDMAEFFLVDKRVRDVALSTRSTFPFVRGQVGFVGFRREGIPYKRERRIVGKTHYNLIGAARFGFSGVLTSSTLALRLLAYWGFPLVPLNMVLALAMLFAGDGPSGARIERCLLALVAFELGWAMLAFGFIGIYLARVYKDSIALPLYVVDTALSSESNVPPVSPGAGKGP
ncbi:glycosyltransferase family 2 protein [Pendulispora brunnea]|uniref:Glycosyltransferase family 2 protein n=1 Tax=Pendulispora brunnea TaxID=2905690 RepID=A0ABZ2K4R2_9BACT